MRLRLPFIVLACAALAACSSLLPRGSNVTPEGFASFEEGRAAAERIEALKTATSDLRGLGFDPVEGDNVTLIPYPDIVGRLAPNSAVPYDKLDAGIRQCIEAQSSCRGYLFHFERQNHVREGSFVLDFLNVRRTTHTTGWWFDALIVVTDGTVLFRNYAGQANTQKVEKQVNPLGPLQPGPGTTGWVLIH